jgi:hypothetical protein
MGDPGYGDIVQSDERRASGPKTVDRVRRQVLEVAADTLRGASDGEPGAAWLPGDSGCHHAATDTYLALLQDQLPVYVRAMMDLRASVGQGSVRDSLLRVARATFDFYCGVLDAKVKVIADPDQLVRLREHMRVRGLGPDSALDLLTGHLLEEQERGRLAADVSPAGTASLLLGACLHYAFIALMMGEAGLPPRDDFIAGLVAGLRLEP